SAEHPRIIGQKRPTAAIPAESFVTAGTKASGRSSVGSAGAVSHRNTPTPSATAPVIPTTVPTLPMNSAVLVSPLPAALHIGGALPTAFMQFGTTPRNWSSYLSFARYPSTRPVSPRPAPEKVRILPTVRRPLFTVTALPSFGIVTDWSLPSTSTTSVE